ncbi:unnamed protein product [Peniophora sp. CBMAI 1063]|nr:unnamed protein product [Peniophora sp. CBMAI 1063]
MQPREVDYTELFSSERRWRDKQPYLQSRGYMLRPRLRPGWVPSWTSTGEDPLDCEDGIRLPARAHLVDATRMSDGKLVYVKRIKTGDQESSIASVLSSEPLRKDPRNHTVPVEDVFVDDEDPSTSYLVMPFLRRPTSPPFEYVGEVVDFVDQVLEGLTFMHDQGVAHRDCAMPNIMMDASALFPDGFHPIKQYSLPHDIRKESKWLPRMHAGVRYYFVDYGISSYFPPGQPRERVTGILGREQAVPELSNTKPYDPFAVDVCIIGNLLHAEFLKQYSNVSFLQRLATEATRRNPEDRPDAAALLRLWTVERRRVSAVHKSWRLHDRGESLVETAARDCFGLIGSAWGYAGSVLGWK